VGIISFTTLHDDGRFVATMHDKNDIPVAHIIHTLLLLLLAAVKKKDK
jgi:hypothetical protein